MISFDLKTNFRKLEKSNKNLWWVNGLMFLMKENLLLNGGSFCFSSNLRIRIWRPPSQSKLTALIFNMEIIHLSLEVSLYLSL